MPKAEKFMLDKELRKILKDVSGTKAIKREIREALGIHGSNGECRRYDISYLLNGLTVHVEAVHAEANGFSLSSAPAVVTLKQSENYNKALSKEREEFDAKNQPMEGQDETLSKKIESAIQRVFSSRINCYSGVLVDSAKDRNMQSARVKRVLVEYSGINLAEFDNRSDWASLISALAKKYNVGTAEPSNGIIEITHHGTSGIIHMPGERAHEPEIRYFTKEIRDLHYLRRGIEAVLMAGQKLETAVRKESDRLVRNYA